MNILETRKIVAAMQSAVDCVLTSEHATSQVAACIFNPSVKDSTPLALVNIRPESLKACFPWDARIGASSQFIHAELACIAAFQGPLKGSHICLTDPFCPNCAKNMAEAGVRTVYIDHKGFKKDFIARNETEFASMSMLIAEKAGMSVYVVNRKEESITPILAQTLLTTRAAPSAIEFFDVDTGLTLETAMATFRKRFGANEAWTIAFVREPDGAPRGLLVFEALPPGMTPEDFKNRDSAATGKYRFPLDPLTRLLITMKRMKFTLLDPRIGCACVPSSRAIVNALGFGVKNLALGSRHCDHDPIGIQALDLCAKNKIINIEEIP